MATPYNFVTPIRYFKANDPYYYEVDNLPLRQLEENILYVKDKLARAPDPDQEISIYSIKELRPKVGGGRTVKVNAGRFIARINDAYDINKPLAELTRETLPVIPDILPRLSQLIWSEAKNNAVWDAFIGPLAAESAYNTNGLETQFTFYSTPVGSTTGRGQGPAGGRLGQGAGASWGVNPHVGTGGDFPWYEGQNAYWQNLWPHIIGNWNKFLAGNPFLGTSIGWGGGDGNGIPSLHLLFVQMWRGVFRTAVVDVPDCTIQIPPFESGTFRYYDKNPSTGGKHITTGVSTQRIDLLVAYSMPVDTSSTTIVEFDNKDNVGLKGTGNTWTSDGKFPPTKLTKPMLGLVMGGGVAIMKSTERHPSQRPISVGNLEAGTGVTPWQKIVQSTSDQEPLANAGITDINNNKVHASFPSPDDLMNIAPVLAMDVGGDSNQEILDQLQLIGQTALPLAYIVVRKGQDVIKEEDIIDIRPFLRTTEFTYNERAGIAAANPPLSFANPAVGAYQLQHVIDMLKGASAGGGPSPQQSRAQPLYTDYIMGGLAYGVEGTMLTMCDGTVQNTDDPFGTRTTTTAKFISNAPGNPEFDFSWAKSSKDFMERSVLRDKQALLEYFYRMRQGDLKGWLANPNETINTGGGKRSDTYLGLPGGDQSRRIPLYPEWDMPMDSASYNTVVTGKNLASPPETWWMWIEGQSIDRPLIYGPGSLLLNVAGSQYGYLDSRLGLGWGRNPHSTLGRGTVVSVSKSIDVDFPEWVQDYDVVADYVNCAPVTMAMPSLGANGQMTNENTAGQYGMGAGISVNKSTIAGNRATITINSVASPYPEGTDGILTNAGMIGDTSGPLNSPGSNVPQRSSAPTLAGASFQWLAYTVCLPQFSQQNFNCMRQNAGRSQTITRSTPKFGAAIYPTVKFTIIGYPDSPVSRNTRYNATSHWGLIQDVSRGDRGVIINSLPPLGGRASINIEGDGT